MLTEKKQISESQRRNSPWDESNEGEAHVSNREDADVAAIVAGCQQNDPLAQRQLYEIFHHLIYRLMVRMVRIQDAADLTQQVFLQTFRNIGKFSSRSSFRTWIYRLAVNEALQHLRRNRRWRNHQTLEYEPMDQSPGHDKNTEQTELIEKALDELDPDLRSTFLLKESDGLSYREIAEVLQIAEGTVASRLNKARRALKEHLTKLGWEPQQ